jgi:hypothetical protein
MEDDCPIGVRLYASSEDGGVISCIFRTSVFFVDWWM